MKIIEKIKAKHVLLFCILVQFISIAVSYGLLWVSHLVVTPSEIGSNSYYLLREIIVLLGSIAIVFVTKQTKIFKFNLKGFLKSQWSGAYFYFLVVIGIVVVADEIKVGGEYKSVVQIVAFILFVLTVGLAEEAINRGIIAECLINKYGNTVKGTIGAVLFSSFIFGFSHISNFFVGESFGATFTQIVSTSMLGILLGAIYYKHRSYFGVALLHGLLDFTSMSDRGLLIGRSVGEFKVNDVEFLTQFVSAMRSQITFVIVAVIILRPSVIRKIIAARK